MALQWKQDHLGERYACAELDLGHDDEGPVNATLVSYKAGIQSVPETGSVPTVGPGEVPARLNAVLYIHGWSDYFFQRELAEFFAGLGIAFYALDLRKCGRSYRSWQTPGYVTSLSDYDADIDTALEALTSQLRNDHGEDAEINTFLMAHSTGALIASLWARRFPGRISALVLNSPWLDVQGSSIIRNTTQGLLEPITRFRPKARLKLPEFGFYWRSISNEADGEWQLHPEWRPQFGYPIRAGWLTAILAGHAQVRKGLDIPVPILVLASSRSTISPAWNETMLSTDSVLDVTLMTQRALQLGSNVTVCRFEGALHDVLLSRRPVRSQVYFELERWIGCYTDPKAGQR